MRPHPSLLVSRMVRVDKIPLPQSSKKRGRGRPTVYPDLWFLKARIGMIGRSCLDSAAELTPANVADNEAAEDRIRFLPHDARDVLGDLHSKAPNVRDAWEPTDRFLVTTPSGCYPHTDSGVEGRRLFHQLRSQAIENVNEPFKGIFDAPGQVPPQGLIPPQRFA